MFGANGAVVRADSNSGVVGVVTGHISDDSPRVASQVQIAFSGKLAVKITEDNGAIHAGDKLGISKTLPGYATKLTASGQSLGVALADSTAGTDTIMASVDLTYQQMDIGASADNKQITAKKDVDLFGNAILNIKALASASGKWSIGADGLLTVSKVKADVGEFGSVQSKSINSELGVTITDRTTGQLYCMFVNNGQVSTVLGNCDSTPPSAPASSSPDPAPVDVPLGATTPSTDTPEEPTSPEPTPDPSGSTASTPDTSSPISPAGPPVIPAP